MLSIFRSQPEAFSKHGTITARFKAHLPAWFWWLPLGLALGLAVILFSWASSSTIPVSPTLANNNPMVNPYSRSSKEMPADLYAAYSLALQQDAPANYLPVYSGPGQYQLANRGYGLKAGFNNQGLEVNGWQMRLVSYGYSGEAKTTADQPSPLLYGKRVEFRYSDGLTEWYINSELGLEQGFTLAKPLSGNSNGELELKLSLVGITAKIGANAEWLELSDGLRYGQLVAWDSTGRKLTSRLETTGSEIILRVDGCAAVYPITIDPYLQQQLLKSDDGAWGDNFGYSVALSSDGNTALIGAYNKILGQNQIGAAYVFTRSGNSWSQQQQLTNANEGGNFGRSVALSGDGNTALIGAEERQAAYVFTRSGLSWFQRQRLLPFYNDNFNHFGWSVALSSSGNTILVGANVVSFGTSTFQGAAFTFNYVAKLNSATNLAYQPTGNHPLGQPVTVTATITDITNLITPTSTVTFTVNNGAPITSILNTAGKATLLMDGLSLGSYTITANYSGDFNFNGSNAQPITFNVVKLDTTANLTYQSEGTPKVGQPITLTATVSWATGSYTPTGTVTFKVNDSPTVTATLSATGQVTAPYTFQNFGIYSVSATYSGDANFYGSNSLLLRIIVDPLSSLIVTNISDDGTGLTNGSLFQAISNTAGGGAITFQLTSGSTITVTGKLPDVKVGTFIEGSCSNPITIQGNGVNSNGLVLKGNATLVGLTIRGFIGIQIVTSGTGNKLACVKAIR